MFGIPYLMLPFECVVLIPFFDLNQQIRFQSGYTIWQNWYYMMAERGLEREST